MQALNEAYSVLGNPELKKRYDLDENIFSKTYEDEINEELEEIKEEREKLKREKEWRREFQKKLDELKLKGIDSIETVNEIIFFMKFPPFEVWDLEEKKYGKLWESYSGWQEKIWKMPITVNREKKKSDELKEFKEKILEAIKETRERKIEKNKDRKTGIEKWRFKAISQIRRWFNLK